MKEPAVIFLSWLTRNDGRRRCMPHNASLFISSFSLVEPDE
ncbi:hypothetical protein CPT_21_74 [Escherichia phage 21]|nr:hypothetical protein HMPREF9532_00745 [Escherichia coli MS 57-2]UMO75485.1 hypothetical protein CPT_21_74 [Escherichia phage 21]